MAGQNAPAPAAPGAGGARDAASPPPVGLDDTPLSPDDQASLLDYITHEDGSVTCKLCGEQVGAAATSDGGESIRSELGTRRVKKKAYNE